MKGVIFTEFTEMVEERFSAEMLDRIMQEADLASGGVYTSVGTYDYHEMLSLVDRLSAATGIAAIDLQRVFGEHLFGRFHTRYPGFFSDQDGAFGFIGRIENHIHVEVLKLYPEAELPTFEVESIGDDGLRVEYRSSRPFSNLAAGLLRGCIAHFNERHDIVEEDISGGMGNAMRFILTRRADAS